MMAITFFQQYFLNLKISMDFGRKISQLFLAFILIHCVVGKNQPPNLETLRVDTLLSTLWIGWVYFCSSNAL